MSEDLDIPLPDLEQILDKDKNIFQLKHASLLLQLINYGVTSSIASSPVPNVTKLFSSVIYKFSWWARVSSR